MVCNLTLQSSADEPFTNRYETNCVGQCWVTKKMGFSLYGKTWNVYGTVIVDGKEYHTDTVAVSDPVSIVEVNEVGFTDSDGNGSHNLRALGFREDTVQDHKFNEYVLPQNATNQTVVWSSSDNSIATVTQDGYIRVTGKIGETIITASCGGKSKSIRVYYYQRQ